MQAQVCRQPTKGLRTQRAAPSRARRCVVTKAEQSPSSKIMELATKEPVAFFGGVFAGVLNLPLTDEPLKSWLERTASQAGVVLPSRIGSSSTREPDVVRGPMIPVDTLSSVDFDN